MTPGQWTQLSELRPTRKALVIQSLGGVLILGINTDAPMVTNSFGTMPAGLWSSIDTGAGPATFRLDSTNDDELSQQAWYGWLVPGSLPSPVVPVVLGNDGDNEFGVGTPAPSVTFSAGAALLTASVFCVVIGASPPVLTSGLIGVIAPAAIAVTPSVGGNFGYTALYEWSHPGGTDTVTVTDANEGFASCGVYYTAGAAALDATGTNVGNNYPIVVTSSSPTVAPAMIFGAWLASQYNSTPDPTPQTFFDGATVIDNNSVSWGGNVYYLVLSILAGPVQLTWPNSTGAVYGDWSAAIVTVTLPGAAVQPVVTVIEAFDVVIPPQQNYLSVQMPTVGPDALAYLQDMQQKILAAQAPPPVEENTDVAP